MISLPLLSLLPKKQNPRNAGAPQSRTLGTPGGQDSACVCPAGSASPLPCLARPRRPQRAQHGLSPALGVYGVPSLPPPSGSPPYRCDPSATGVTASYPSASPSIRCSWPHLIRIPLAASSRKPTWWLQASQFSGAPAGWTIPRPSPVLCHGHAVLTSMSQALCSALQPTTWLLPQHSPKQF